MNIADGLVYLALAFLAVHLLMDVRRLVQVLKLHHHQWWEVATLVALAGHLTLDYVT